MMKGGHGQTNQLHDITWGILNHASRAHATRPSHFSACKIEKLGRAWDEASG